MIMDKKDLKEVKNAYLKLISVDWNKLNTLEKQRLEFIRKKLKYFISNQKRQKQNG